MQFKQIDVSYQRIVIEKGGLDLNEAISPLYNTYTHICIDKFLNLRFTLS